MDELALSIGSHSLNYLFIFADIWFSATYNITFPTQQG